MKENQSKSLFLKKLRIHPSIIKTKYNNFKSTRHHISELKLIQVQTEKDFMSSVVNLNISRYWI